MTTHPDSLRIALAQIAPVWLDRDATLGKVVARIEEASAAGARMVAFGEALVPGYPFWIEHTDGARFDAPLQKALFAHYAEQAVQLQRGDLAPVCVAARAGRIWVVLGTIERAPDRGGHSLYCSVVVIDDTGALRNVHRKLVPTYEERLVWAPGDGHGLRSFELDGFTLGALNCWENWMPLARAALYAQGVNLHVALWPGNPRNTQDITRFIALEARSYVLSVCGLLRSSDLPADLPHADLLRAALPDTPAAGGSCVAGPEGDWLLPPAVGEEALLLVDLQRRRVLAARQNFDPSGHYARPDVLRLRLDRRRQSVLEDEGE